MRHVPHAIGVALATAASVAGWHQGMGDESAKSQGIAAVTGGVGSGMEAGAVESGTPAGTGRSALALLRGWAERLAAADGVGLVTLAEEAAREPDWEIRKRLMRLVGARWSEVDPEGGVAYFHSLPPGQDWPRMSVLVEWALRDVEAALRFLSGLGDEHASDIDSVGRELMLEDAEVFWVWFQKAGRPNPGNPSLSGDSEPVWTQIARRHPAELEAMAHAAAAGAKEGNPRDQGVSARALLAAVASARAGEDPAAALDWARAQPAEFRAACLQRVLPMLAARDPHAAMAAFDALHENEWATAGTGGRELLKALPGLLEAVGRSDPQAALSWAARLSVGTEVVAPVNDVVRSALADGRLTPRAAYALVHAQPTPGESIRINVLRKMWRGLPAEALAASASWLNGAESSPFKGPAMAGIITEWALSNREEAFAFARQVEDPAVRHSIWGEVLATGFGSAAFATAMGSQLAVIPATDRPAVIAEHLRLQYGGGLLESRHGLTLPDPRAYAEALMEAPVGPDRAETAKKVMDYWGALDPASAMAWTGQHTEGAERAQALAGLVAGWARHDAWAVSEWLAEQPAGADGDAATRQLVQSISPTDPEGAWTWAAKITDPAARLQAWIDVQQRWRARDPVAAEAALAAAPHLAPHERRAIAEAFTRDREPR